jgi:putative oxidoreductase
LQLHKHYSPSPETDFVINQPTEEIIMNEAQLQKSGITLLRISLGVVLLAHSAYLKIVVYGVAGTVGFFESLGLPAAAAYMTMGAEIATGIALIAGYQVRAVSLAIIPVLIGATWVHAGNGWVFSNAGGGWEYPVFLIVAALVQAMLGSGRENQSDITYRIFRPVSA